MLKIGLYGLNGHQVHNSVEGHALARLTAISQFPRNELPETMRKDSSIKEYPTLDEMLFDKNIDLICLCSPRRSNQAKDAIECLLAGKHVLAEKPCAMTEDDLNAIINTASQTGKVFHEMAGTAFTQPYYAMRQIVQSGRLGEIVQVIVEKSYPYGEWRPQNEDIDGGLICQNGVHAIRMIEHVAGTPIVSVQAQETSLGNPIAGSLKIAASINCQLENGGLASVNCNYLNQRGVGIWGNESLKILGDKGFVESRDGGKYTRLVIGDEDHGPIEALNEPTSWFDRVLHDVIDHCPMPINLTEELSPTRWAIRAKRSTDNMLNTY